MIYPGQKPSFQLQTPPLAYNSRRKPHALYPGKEQRLLRFFLSLGVSRGLTADHSHLLPSRDANSLSWQPKSWVYPALAYPLVVTAVFPLPTPVALRYWFRVLMGSLGKKYISGFPCIPKGNFVFSYSISRPTVKSLVFLIVSQTIYVGRVWGGWAVCSHQVKTWCILTVRLFLSPRLFLFTSHSLWSSLLGQPTWGQLLSL